MLCSLGVLITWESSIGISFSLWLADLLKDRPRMWRENTIDGRTPTPVGRWFLMFLPLFTGFFIHPSWDVWDFWTINSSYSSFPILVEDLKTACTEASASIARVISTNAGSANIDNKSQAFLAWLARCTTGVVCGCCWSLENSYIQNHAEISWCNTCIATNQIEMLNSNFQFLLIDGQNPALKTVYCVNISKISYEMR